MRTRRLTSRCLTAHCMWIRDGHFRLPSIPLRKSEGQLDPEGSPVLEDRVLPMLFRARVSIGVIEEVVEAGRDLHVLRAAPWLNSVRLGSNAPGTSPPAMVRRAPTYWSSTPADSLSLASGVMTLTFARCFGEFVRPSPVSSLRLSSKVWPTRARNPLGHRPSAFELEPFGANRTRRCCRRAGCSMGSVCWVMSPLIP